MKEQFNYKGTWECYPRDWMEVKNICIQIEEQQIKVSYSFTNGAIEKEFYRYKMAAQKDGTINLYGSPYSLLPLNLSDKLIISRHHDGIFKAFDYLFSPVREKQSAPSIGNGRSFGNAAYPSAEEA